MGHRIRLEVGRELEWIPKSWHRLAQAHHCRMYLLQKPRKPEMQRRKMKEFVSFRLILVLFLQIKALALLKS